MANLVFANNATTSLAAPITTESTSITVAAGTGGVFHSITGNQYFYATLRDSATKSIREIVKVTGLSGDTLTVVRAQEGTTAYAFSAGDLIDQFVTAGTVGALCQSDGSAIYAIDTSLTAGAIVASISPGINGLVAGTTVMVKVASAVTVGSTLSLNGFGAYPVVGPDRVAITGNPLASGAVGEFTFTGDAWQLIGALPTSPALTGTPTTPTAAPGTNTTQIASTAFVGTAISNAVLPADANPLMDGTAAIGSSPRYARQDHVHPTDTSRAPLESPMFTGTPTAPTAAPGTNTTQIASTAFVRTAAYGTFSPGASGYVKLPNGFIMQWGVAGTATTNPAPITFPIPFPAACVSVQATIAGYSVGGSTFYALAVGSISTTGAVVASGYTWSTSLQNGPAFTWFAVGY